jgi:ABC-type multidrug transport system fused ATPase/permease subunit
MTELAAEFTNNFKLIKSTSTEEYSLKKFSTMFQFRRNIETLAGLWPPIMKSTTEFMGVVALCAVIALAVTYLKVPASEILLTLVLFQRTFTRLSGCARGIQNLAQHLPALSNLAGSISSTLGSLELPVRGSGKKVPTNFSAIRLENVNVVHGELVACHDVAAVFEKGKIVVLTGKSGSGKSSLIDAIVGLSQTRGGSVLLDNQVISARDSEEYRRLFGYVCQESFLFSTSIFENICWGIESPTEKDVVNAAKRAQIHEFIVGLPQGYDTVLTHHGSNLSGGQKQRIALARALYGRKQCLILDEATSALDRKTELEILAEIVKLKRDYIVILASHSEAVLAIADTIYLVEQGRVREIDRNDAASFMPLSQQMQSTG